MAANPTAFRCIAAAAAIAARVMARRRAAKVRMMRVVRKAPIDARAVLMLRATSP
jgi:hypothetical protein